MLPGWKIGEVVRLASIPVADLCIYTKDLSIWITSWCICCCCCWWPCTWANPWMITLSKSILYYASWPRRHYWAVILTRTIPTTSCICALTETLSITPLIQSLTINPFKLNIFRIRSCKLTHALITHSIYDGTSCVAVSGPLWPKNPRSSFCEISQ